jgi:chaperonin cofactor prefoldin
MQLRELVLYNDEGETRSIHLRPGELNIITGESRSGKSALVDIISFCLGGSFQVPAGLIREAVSWYGLRLTVGETEVFIARPRPSPGRGSAVTFQAGQSVQAPALADLEPTTNVDGLERLLTGLLGIRENEQLPPVGARRPVPTLQANVSHAALFCFQLQDEIANRRLLFHRQQEPFIPQAIADVFPYFLGAVESDTIALRTERREVKRELDDARGRLARLVTIRNTAREQALALAAEAVAVGLIPEVEELPTAETEFLLQVLREASARAIDEASPPGNALQNLEEARSSQVDEYRELQDQLQLVRSALREHEDFRDVVATQVARLESIDLLPEGSDAVCPLCGQETHGSVPTVTQVRATFEHLSTHLDAVDRDRPRLRATLNDLEERSQTLRHGIHEITTALEELAATESRTAEIRARGQEQAFVRGKVGQYLSTLAQAGDEEVLDLERQVRVLEERLSSLDERLTSESARSNAVSILNVVGSYMSEWAARLQLERRSVRIDLSALTVVADTEAGAIPLAFMGSAENWVGYHLVAHLGLHKHFVERDRPVPRFLILDQPTQAYFPPDIPSGVEMPERDADRQAVTRMFELFRDVAAELAPHFQLLVLDHLKLDTEWFERSVVEEWRGGSKLIPAHWYSLL